jgi:ribonucleoside-diphosphate reductase beta chain
MYLSRQLYEEALHVQFYLTLLDTYIPEPRRAQAGVRRHRQHPVDQGQGRLLLQVDRTRSHELDELNTREDRRAFLLNLICFGSCIEGLFFFAAFAYVYFLRSKGLLNGLASGTNWVFRDESMHMNFALAVVEQVREEEPDLFDDELEAEVRQMMTEAVECEYAFAEDLLSQGVTGLSLADTRSTCSSSPTSASAPWATRPSGARRTRSGSSTSRTCRS